MTQQALNQIIRIGIRSRKRVQLPADSVLVAVIAG